LGRLSAPAFLDQVIAGACVGVLLVIVA